MKLTHKQKVKLARKLRTRKELKKRPGFPRGTPIFQTKAWEERKEARRRKHENRCSR